MLWESLSRALGFLWGESDGDVGIVSKCWTVFPFEIVFGLIDSQLDARQYKVLFL